MRTFVVLAWIALIIASLSLVRCHAQERVIQKATQDQVDGGTNDTRYVTPKTLATRLAGGGSSTNLSGFIPQLNGDGTNLTFHGVPKFGLGSFPDVDSSLALGWLQLQADGKFQLSFDGSSLTSVNAATGDSATAFFSSGTIELARGGTGASLADPNADRILFWDDSAGVMDFLTPGAGLIISGTTISSTAGTGSTNIVNNGTSVEVTNPDGATGLYLEGTTTRLSLPHVTAGSRQPSIELDPGGLQMSDQFGNIFMDAASGSLTLQPTNELIVSSASLDDTNNVGIDYVYITAGGTLARRRTLENAGLTALAVSSTNFTGNGEGLTNLNGTKIGIATNTLGSAVVDFAKVVATTNMAGNLTFTGIINFNPTNENVFVLHCLANGIDRTITPASGWLKTRAAFVVTNGTMADLVIKCQVGLYTNIAQTDYF